MGSSPWKKLTSSNRFGVDKFSDISFKFMCECTFLERNGPNFSPDSQKDLWPKNILEPPYMDTRKWKGNCPLTCPVVRGRAWKDREPRSASQFCRSLDSSVADGQYLMSLLSSLCIPLVCIAQWKEHQLDGSLHYALSWMLGTVNNLFNCAESSPGNFQPNQRQDVSPLPGERLCQYIPSQILLSQMLCISNYSCSAKKHFLYCCFLWLTALLLYFIICAWIPLEKKVSTFFLSFAPSCLAHHRRWVYV